MHQTWGVAIYDMTDTMTTVDSIWAPTTNGTCTHSSQLTQGREGIQRRGETSVRSREEPTVSENGGDPRGRGWRCAPRRTEPRERCAPRRTEPRERCAPRRDKRRESAAAHRLPSTVGRHRQVSSVENYRQTAKRVCRARPRRVPLCAGVPPRLLLRLGSLASRACRKSGHRIV